MQLIDGKLYPPMSARVEGEDGKMQLREPSELGTWEEAEERPDLADKNGKFKLDKANGSTVPAAYNPYFHTSWSPLNDQFSSAYTRDNLVTVEGEIPESELTSGYKADKGKEGRETGNGQVRGYLDLASRILPSRLQCRQVLRQEEGRRNSSQSGEAGEKEEVRCNKIHNRGQGRSHCDEVEEQGEDQGQELTLSGRPLPKLLIYLLISE